MSRSIKKGPYVEGALMKRIQDMNTSGKKAVVKTWSRSSTIFPDFVGHTIAVHDGRKHVPVYVTEDMLASIKLNQDVLVHLDSYSQNKDSKKKDKKSNGITFNGKVTWISPKAEFTPKMIQTKEERSNLVYAVKVNFLNDGSAKIGMPGDVEFK